MRKAALEVTFSSALISKLNILMFPCAPLYEATICNVSTLDDINDFVFTKWGIETEYTALLLHNTDFGPSIRFLQSCQSFLLEKSCFPCKTKRYGYRLK